MNSTRSSVYHVFTSLVFKCLGLCLLITSFSWSITHAQTCTQWPGGPINDGETVYGYSTILWTTTGQDYSEGCSPFQGPLTCQHGILLQNPATYPYTLTQCQSGTPKNCTQWAGGTIPHGHTVFGYSTTGASYPKTCSDFSTSLSCTNGNIDGNFQTYKYTSTQCQNLNQLVSGVDITINESPTHIKSLLSQGSSPKIAITFKNKGDTAINQSNVSAGFLTCLWKEKNITVYTSKLLSQFVLNPGTKKGVSISLLPIFTKALGVKTLECRLNARIASIPNVNTTNDLWSGTFEVVQADRFDLALSTSIGSISTHLEAPEGALGTQGLQNFVFDKLMNVLVPLIIIIGILSAILGFYKLMFSAEDAARKEGIKYILFGVLGIIIIVSAKFLGQNIYDILSVHDLKGVEVAQSLYNTILYPFIKFAIYLVLGVMFIILVSRVITFLFGSDSDAIKKSGTIIGWNVIAMLIIIGAKQIVELVYGKQADVVKEATNLGEIGTGMLADKNIPLLYQIINYALGIASLVILVVIIFQTIKLLMKPDDPAQIKSIKNSLLYMFIGILIIGLGYLIVNFAIIN